MAKNKIVIAELELDVDGLLEAAKDSKKAIEKLKKELLELKDAGKESSEQFRQNRDDLQRLTQTLDTQLSVLKQQVKKTEDLADAQKDVNKATKKNIETQEELAQSYSAAANSIEALETTAKDASQTLAGLNTAMQQNESLMTKGATSTATNTKTFNDYKEQVKESFDSINVFNGGLGGLISRAQEAGGTGPLLKTAFGGITSGIMGMTKAAWGFVTNPIGAILTAIVLAVEAGIAIFKDFTPVINKVQQVMAGVGAVVESVKNSVIGLLTGATSLGDFFSGFAGSASKAASEAMKLKEAQQQLTEATELQEVANAEAQKQIDGLIAKSEDQALSEKDRLDALKEATAAEKKNFDERKALSDKAYNIALDKIANGKNLTAEELKDLKEKGFAYAQELFQRKSISKEELDALREAQIERTKIYGEEEALSRKQADREAKIHAEFQAKREADHQKAMEMRQKSLDDALSKQKQLLDLYVAQHDTRRMSLEDQIKYEKEFADKSLAIAKEEFKQKKISWTEYQTTTINIEKKRVENIAGVNAEYAEAQLNLYKEQHQSSIKAGQELTKTLVDEEKKRLDEIYRMNVELLKKQNNLDAEVIRKKALNHETLTAEEANFYTELLKLDKEHVSEKKALTDSYAEQENKKDEAKAEKIAQEAAEKKARDFEVNNSEYEQKLQLEDERHTAEVAKYTQWEADGVMRHDEAQQAIREAEMKSAEIKQQLAIQAAQTQLGTLQNVANALGEAFGQGKELAIAQATMNAGQAILSIWAGSITGNPLVDSVLKTALSVSTAAKTAKQIKEIQSAKKPKQPKLERGGLMAIGGNRHSNGGTLFTGTDGTRFEAEQGELIGVMNRNAARHFMAFNNAFPAGGVAAPNYFANGGIVSREITQQSLNLDELAAKIAMANQALPAPVVAVEDIITRGNSYIQVREGANF